MAPFTAQLGCGSMLLPSSDTARVARLPHIAVCEVGRSSNSCIQGRASTSGREHLHSLHHHRQPAYRCRHTLTASASSNGGAFSSSFPTSSLGSPTDNNNAQNNGKLFDVVALSNLCVDVFVHVDELPPSDQEVRRQLLTDLSAHPPPVESWEVGGNTNFLIAASRLGLRTASVGQLGEDVYGNFLENVLKEEGIRTIEPMIDGKMAHNFSTLLCFVLVAPGSKHAFCSSYDFGPWPLLSFAKTLPAGVQKVLDNTAALFINGFAFDDLPADLVLGAAQRARFSGAAVFFDPGPRSWTFQEGDRAAALNAMLNLSDVVLMTEEEAAAVTGISDAESAAHYVLDRPGAATQWCIIKRGAQGAIVASITDTATHLHDQAALDVDVRDTVGCGDSFAAAVVLGYTQQHSVPVVMALANAVGAATAMGAGAGRNVASAETVLQLLKSEAATCEDGRHSGAIEVLTMALEMAGRASKSS